MGILCPDPESSNKTPTSPLDLSRSGPFFRTDQAIFIADLTPSPSDLSPRISFTSNRQMSVDCSYDAPQIITPPKTEWHYRSTRDLAKKHIPFLPGDGPQRTPIRIKIPAQYSQQMYLAINVVTEDEDFHDSKLVVPAKTKVDSKYLTRDNNLNCLIFDECNSSDRFDPSARHVYLQISPEEHRVQMKEVRVHMFNLYQNSLITKELIEMKKLHLCRIAVWLCLFENGHYIPVSERTFSSVIQEKNNSTRSNILQPITTNDQSNAHSRTYMDDDVEDEMTDNDAESSHSHAFSVNSSV